MSAPKGPAISVLTLVRNEEHNIAECLESVQWADEIVVVDSGSTDGTVEKAARFTNRVLQMEWKGYGATKNAAMQHCTGDWILWLDADERVPEALAGEIREVVRANDPSCAGYDVARRAYFLGRWIRHSGWYPGRVTRLARRERAQFTEARVHEQLRVDGRIGSLRNDLLHYTDPDLRHYFRKFNRYTSLAAEDLYTQGRRSRISDLLVRPAFQFVKMYILRRGFLDGVQGLILAVVSAGYVFTKYAKLWELYRK